MTATARSGAEKTRAIGPYSRAGTLRKLDGRTREAALLRRVRADLVAHVGGSPSAVQLILIGRAATLTLRLAQLDGEPQLSEHDMRQYGAWDNHLRLVLRELGLRAAEPKPPSIGEYLARRAAERAEAEGRE